MLIFNFLKTYAYSHRHLHLFYSENAIKGDGMLI